MTPRPRWRRSDPARRIRDGIPLAGADRVLAVGRDTHGGGWLAATIHTVAALEEDGAVRWQRPWHLVDSGSWDRDTEHFALRWVDDQPPASWRFGPEQGRLLDVVRERIQASVVAAADVTAAGRRIGRVAIRQDLATGALQDQVLLRRGVSSGDAVVAAALRDATIAVHDVVGLPPGSP